MIRKITALDITALVEIEKQCFSQIWSLKNIEDALKSERNILLCIEDQGLICGYVFADFVLDEVNINRIAILPDFRKKGLASNLLAELEACVEDFAACIMLEVRQSNGAAQALYRKNGYKIVGNRKGFYSEPYEDAVLMTKFLKKMEQ